MSAVEQQRYSLGHTAAEHERLRRQARVWEAATGRLLDDAGLRRGATCLDAGCGPGETMRLMAERVGAAGRVTGIDLDAALGAIAVGRLRADGHHQCRFERHDLTSEAPLPGAPYDAVYARLVLYHLPQRVEVLARLWAAVAPGGHLIVQDYDLRSLGVLPALDSVDEIGRVLMDAFGEAGCDVHVGAKLPQLFAQVGAGEPDGTDVAGRLEPLEKGRLILESTFRSLLPVALAHGITTEAQAAQTLDQLQRDVARFPGRPMMWPLMIGAWKGKRARA